MAATASLLTSLQTGAAAAGQVAGPAVVRIGRHGGRGCGVIVAKDRVLTNAHNLRDRTTEVTFADGRAAQGELLAVDPDGDLAVVTVDTGEVAPIAWADEVPALGTVVFGVGRAAGGGSRLTFGMVSGIERSFRGPRGRQVTGSLEHTAPLARGSSGSPVVDEAGRLVGLNTARLGEGFYLALPADAALRGRVDELCRGASPRRLTLGVGLAPSEVAAKLRASVGLPARAGLLVRTVEEASPADTAGVQVGDLLTASGDVELTTVDDLHRALDAARATSTLPLHLVRGSDELDVTVTFEEPAES
ncbi:MAG: trypsin-like peptidase domain-containing protein [Acidimicrobiales bacterium]